MDCQRFDELIEAYLSETIDEEQRRWWRSHLVSCQRCRASALEREPSLLLATAQRREASPFEVAACARGVRALIHERRLLRRLHRRAYQWIAAAAAVVVLATGGIMMRSLRVAAPVPAPQTAAAEQAQEPSAAPAPEIDVEMDGSNVRVYQYAVDDPNMAVTLIVNPAMEL